jgi:hypothetical protein
MLFSDGIGKTGGIDKTDGIGNRDAIAWARGDRLRPTCLIAG